jgi:hypothetical protein
VTAATEVASPAPVAGSEPVSGRPWRRWLLGAVVAGAGATILLLRPAGARPWQVLWAEDATRFMLAGRQDASAAGLLDVYAGYRHLLPHMIGSLAAVLPLDHAAEVFALSGTVLDIGCLFLFAVGLRRWLPRWWMPVLAVLALTMPVAAAGDVADCAVNLHYFARPGLIGLALLRPRSRPGTVLAVLAALALGLSEPLVLLILPIAVLDALLRGKDACGWGRRLAVPLALTVAGAVQGLTALTHPRWMDPPTTPVPDPFRLYWDYVLTRGLFPHPFRGHHGLTGLLLLLALGGVLAGAALWVEGRAGLARIAVAVGLIVGGAGFLVIDSHYNRAYGPRYTLMPAVLLIAGLLVLAAGNHVLQRGLFVSVVAVSVMGGALNWSVPGHRGLGPTWKPGVVAARQQCAGRPDGMARIPAAPQQFQPLQIRCSWLTRP